MTATDSAAFLIRPLASARLRSRFDRVSDATAWILIIIHCSLVGLLLLIQQGKVLNLLFPMLSTMLGTYLFIVNQRFFLGFAWWLWFLTPEIRRLADYEGGWNAVNPLMLTPLLVSGITAFTAIQCCSALRVRSVAGFAPIYIALFYGVIVGIVTTGPTIAVYSLMTWAVPVLLGFHIAAHWQEYPAYRSTVVTVFGWGGLAMGAYGIIQYFFAPGWDAYWLVNCGMINQGRPYPQEIRVFSTMNSSGPFAFVISSALLLTIIGGARLKLPIVALGVASLLLSLVRAAWLGGILGFAYLLFRLPSRRRLRIIACTVVAGVILSFTLTSGQLGQVIGERFGTLYNLQSDDSYQQREEFYIDFFSRAVTNILGAGIGSTSYVTKLSNYGTIISGFYGDSGVMQIPFVLGWFGSFLYLGGLAMLLKHLFAGHTTDKDLLFEACKAIVLMIAAEMVFENTLINVMGACFWTFLGMGIAAQRHHIHAVRTAMASIGGELHSAAIAGRT